MGKKSNAKKAKKEITETKRVSEEPETKKVSEEPKKTVIEQPEKPEPQTPQMRKIVIETNGNDIRISHDETAGKLELLAILQALIGSLTSPK